MIVGRNITEIAKMIGITPAWLTRSGRKLALRPTSRPPATRGAEGDRQVAAPTLDAAATHLALFLDLLDALGDHRHQLHDDRGVDVWVHAHRDDAEAREATT